jgi:hypothetical protein
VTHERKLTIKVKEEEEHSNWQDTKEHVKALQH